MAEKLPNAEDSTCFACVPEDPTGRFGRAGRGGRSRRIVEGLERTATRERYEKVRPLVELPASLEGRFEDG